MPILAQVDPLVKISFHRLHSRAACMAALFGPWDQLGRFRTIDDLLDHFNVRDSVWEGFEAQVGSPGTDLRLLAALPKVAVVTGCGNTMLDTGPLTPIQATQVGLVWRMARRVVAAAGGTDEDSFIDVDPWMETRDNAAGDAGAAEQPPKQAGGSVKERVLKMNSLIDQQDESEYYHRQQLMWTGGIRTTW